MEEEKAIHASSRRPHGNALSLALVKQLPHDAAAAKSHHY